MAGLPILAIGADPAWRARMQRLFATRADVHWLGAYLSGQTRPCGIARPGLLLLDGDDVRVDRDRRSANAAPPTRLYFFRAPSLAKLRGCLKTGGRGCLDKQVSADATLRAVTAASSGLFVMAPSLLLKILDGASATPMGNGTTTNWFGLTERQRQVVDCVASGMSNKEIARRLQISTETVKTHLHNLFEREGVHGRIALLAEMRRD